MLVCACTSSIV